MSTRDEMNAAQTAAGLRVVITAAGEARRWANHMGVPKHLAPVPAPDGGNETLLRRMVRQARELGVGDVVIVCPPEDTRYETEGARLFPRAINKRWRQADRFMTTELWNKEGRTLYLPGDLYASDAAMQRMIHEPLRDWIWYMRLVRDMFFGVQRSRAVFGFGFWPEHHDFLLMTIKYLNALETNPESPVRRSLGSDIYRAMAHESPKQLARTKGNKAFRDHPPHLVTIEDETTDINSVTQYEHLIRVLSEDCALKDESNDQPNLGRDIDPDEIKLTGRVKPGKGSSSRQQHYWLEGVERVLGKKMFPGTLNMDISEDIYMTNGYRVETKKGPYIIFPIRINDLEAFSVKPPRAKNRPDTLEIMCEHRLREKLSLVDGSEVEITIPVKYVTSNPLDIAYQFHAKRRRVQK